MFIDEVDINVRSGKGGDGIVHFRREKYVPFGGPDGGDGGKGGDILFSVKPTLNTLSAFRKNQKFIAEDGSRAGGNNQTGRSGKDLIINVPPGTLVYETDPRVLIGELISDGQILKVCTGGRGGRGNARFATSKNKAPRIAEKGEPFEERWVTLELKLIADIGIIGVPNAGKSTLLSVVTNATPKIAPYPFTTLQPNLGVARIDDEHSLILADIPGLIEGAHRGIGLGHSFLRHIQRTRLLIHVLDGLSDEPILDFSQINSELALFDPKLGDKPQIVVFNKMDLPDVEQKWPAIKNELETRGYTPFPISAVTHFNLSKVLYQALNDIQSLPVEEVEEALPVYRKESDPNYYQITKIQKGWRVTGESIERAAKMTYWEFDQSIRRFQLILSTLGIDDALRQAGIREGDSVFIGDHELEWSD